MEFTFKSKKLLRVLFLSPILLIQSCNIESLPEISREQNLDRELENIVRPLQDDEFKFFNKILKIPNGLLRWEAQLNEFIKSNSLSTGNNLELLDYKFVNEVVSVEELEVIKSEFVNRFNQIPVKKDNKVQEYKLDNTVFSTKEYEQFLNMLIPTSEVMLKKLVSDMKHDTSKVYEFYKFKSDDLSTVKLIWNYNGEVFNTLCLISKQKGIIYDPFLYFISYSPRGDISQYSKIVTSSSRFQAFGGEQGVVINDIDYRQEYSQDSYSAWGLLQWAYRIDIEASGEETNGTKSMDHKRLYASYESGLLFSCTSACTSLSFETGENGHLDVAYGASYKVGAGAGLSFNGFSFTITGGATGATGNDYIDVDDLY